MECNISSDPDGAVLANVGKPSVKSSVDPYSRAGSGMGPTWGGVAINVLRRLDGQRSPLHFIMTSREKFDAMLCPVKVEDQSVIIGILLVKNTNVSKIYEALRDLIAT